jgi:hypothetical protein
MDSVWKANKHHWRKDALCAGVRPDLFFPKVETNETLARIRRAYCNQCPVMAVCLNSAIIHNDSGYWGGTNTAQRKAMRRTRSRSRCPLCNSQNLVRVRHGEEREPCWYEVCLNCAASWRADERPNPRQQVAEKGLHRAAVTPGPPPVKRVKRRPADTPVKTVRLTEAVAKCL